MDFTTKMHSETTIESKIPRSATTMPRWLIIVTALFGANVARAGTGSLGIFSDQADIGDCAKAGSANFDPATGEYRITGGGANMWANLDVFHFLWKQLSGDFMLTADVRILGTNGNAHRKACLLVRQSLAPDSAYADVALHGDGMAALQWRDAAGERTYTLHSDIFSSQRLRLERRGKYLSMWLAGKDDVFKPAGGYLPVSLTGPCYIGLGVCAHDNTTTETAIFSNVTLEPLATPAKAPTTLECSLEVVAVASADRDIVYRTRELIEAPNWSPDGKYLLFNSKGRIFKLPIIDAKQVKSVPGSTPQLLDTGIAVKCNNDHGISPDGTMLAISDRTEGNKSRVYVVPIGGGAPRLVTPLAPSYWHGWSPEGRTLVYCAERNGNFDVYSIPSAGGAETRLTTTPGLDDGPEYSPDGRYIYFNSERDGMMQIWRMQPDGSGQEPVVADGYHNWFPHPSPDGKWLVFISFNQDVKANQHPANKDVLLRLKPVAGGGTKVLAKLFGGQGTINVPSWSPDSKKLAFVSYQRVYP